ncbi:UNVERIFIED_CONTAM: hypothetical protein RMT77_016835 [Armadillidium vulgare]
MGYRTGLTCIRHTLCVVNTTLWIVGCAILSVGIWLRISYSGYASLLHQYEVLSIDSLCLATGVITFIVAFFACCGAWFRSRCMLMTYFVLLSFVFCLQMVVAVILFAFRESLTLSLRAELKAGIKNSYNDTHENAVAMAWDSLQEQFQCCGVEDWSDWYNINAWPGENWVPESCCVPLYQKDADCGRSGNETLWYEVGCFERVKMWFIKRLHVLGFIVLTVTFIQLFGLISSMLLYCSFKHKRYSRTYRSYQMDT